MSWAILEPGGANQFGPLIAATLTLVPFALVYGGLTLLLKVPTAVALVHEARRRRG